MLYIKLSSNRRGQRTQLDAGYPRQARQGLLSPKVVVLTWSESLILQIDSIFHPVLQISPSQNYPPNISPFIGQQRGPTEREEGRRGSLFCLMDKKVGFWQQLRPHSSSEGHNVPSVSERKELLTGISFQLALNPHPSYSNLSLTGGLACGPCSLARQPELQIWGEIIGNLVTTKLYLIYR